MDILSYVEEIAFFASLLTIASFAYNVIQFMGRKQENKTLKSQAQENYNAYFLIARACDKARINIERSNEKVTTTELDYITGLADVRRCGVVAYSREHLNFIPYFEHPAFPDVKASDALKFNWPSDQLSSPTA